MPAQKGDDFAKRIRDAVDEGAAARDKAEQEKNKGTNEHRARLEKEDREQLEAFVRKLIETHRDTIEETFRRNAKDHPKVYPPFTFCVFAYIRAKSDILKQSIAPLLEAIDMIPGAQAIMFKQNSGGWLYDSQYNSVATLVNEHGVAQSWSKYQQGGWVIAEIRTVREREEPNKMFPKETGWFEPINPPPNQTTYHARFMDDEVAIGVRFPR